MCIINYNENDSKNSNRHFWSIIYFCNNMVWNAKCTKCFLEVKMMSVTVKLDNKCSLDDDSFVVAVPGTDIIVPFRNKIARLRLKSDRKLQLRANPKYPAIRYDGMFVDVKENVILEADCTTSPRLKGIFKSMKDQFKN